MISFHCWLCLWTLFVQEQKFGIPYNEYRGKECTECLYLICILYITEWLACFIMDWFFNLFFNCSWRSRRSSYRLLHPSPFQFWLSWHHPCRPRSCSQVPPLQPVLIWLSSTCPSCMGACSRAPHSAKLYAYAHMLPTTYKHILISIKMNHSWRRVKYILEVPRKKGSIDIRQIYHTIPF